MQGEWSLVGTSRGLLKLFHFGEELCRKGRAGDKTGDRKPSGAKTGEQLQIVSALPTSNKRA